MNRLPRSSQRPLRLVQPYDDDASSSTAVAVHADRSTRNRTPSLGESMSSVASTTHLESIRSVHAHGGVVRKEVQLQGCVQSASSSPLPSFPSRERHEVGAGGSSSVPRIREAGGVGHFVPASASSPPRSVAGVASSVDRLAALYQQYQMPVSGSGRKAAPPKPSRETCDTSHLLSRDAAAEMLTSDESAKHEPRQRDGVRQDEPHAAHPSRLFPLDASGPRVESGAAEASTVSAARAEVLRNHGSSSVKLPPALSEAGVDGLMHIAVHIWATLGFFEMRPREGRTTIDSDSDGEDAASERETVSDGFSNCPELSDPHDTEAFLFALQDFLGLFQKDMVSVPNAAFSALTELVRNGLWRVLFNATFYCVTVLDSRRRRRGAMSRKEGEVRTGGPEDAYEVVFPSSSSVGSVDEGDDGDERQAPVRLTWRNPGESAAQRAARCVRDPIPTESPLRSGGALRGTGVDALGNRVDRRSGGRDALCKEGSQPLARLCNARLRTTLPVAEWYFTLRCLAQVGYARDSFYLQTPSTASSIELLLALLWLTQQYKLLAVAEYVELSRRYGFLLQHHVEEAVKQGPTRESVGGRFPAQAARHPQPRERLLHQFSSATVWPPVTFDENSAIQLRLVQLERCLGRSSSAEASQAPSTQDRNPSAAPQEVRRLLAVRRLVTLSLNRLHHALQRQAEQTVQLGLHSPLDAQLCRKEHHDLYEQVMAGLQYVQHTERRMRAAADGLAKAGSLVAFLLRYEESVVPADEVLLALEEDDATWLSNLDGAEESGVSSDRERKSPRRQGVKRTPAGTPSERWRRAVRRGTLSEPAASSLPTSAAAVVQSLSTFRATHSRAALTETWKRLLRRSHVAPQSVSPENVRFLLDVEAQQIQEARVRDNMTSRYSLQAALAAELAVLGHEEQQQQARRRHPRSSCRRTGGRDDSCADDSTHSPQRPTAAPDVVVQPVRVVLPDLDLVTNAAAAFAQLRVEEEAYGPVALGTAEVQLTEVGVPAAGSTTSARLELERLAALREELSTQLGVRAQTEQRVAHCKEMLQNLYHQFGLRLATPTVLRKASR